MVESSSDVVIVELEEEQQKRSSRTSSPSPAPTAHPGEQETTPTRSKRTHDDMLGAGKTKEKKGVVQEESAQEERGISATPTPGQREPAHLPITPMRSSMPPPSTTLSGQQPNAEKAQERADEVMDEADPGDSLEHFDWVQLQGRLHQKISEQQEAEKEIWAEYNSLLEFFSIWAQVPNDYEVSRAIKRLRTRSTHVKHSEAELEQKRAHYVNVVNAFKSALSLLGG